MTAFIISIHDDFKTQKKAFQQRGSDAIILYDNIAGKRIGQGGHFFSGEVWFERKSPIWTKLEVSPCNRIDLRISGQPEEPYQLNERQTKVLLIPSLTKQVLKCPNQSTMINDLIKNYSQKNAEKVYYCCVPHRDSETHALQNGNLERHEVFQD